MIKRYASMKPILTILLSSLLVCGCSKKHAPTAQSAIALVEAGKDVTLGGLVLHVAKRDGSSIEGIRIVRKEAAGKETTILADTGTLSQGSDQSTVRIVLNNVRRETKSQSGTTTKTSEGMAIEIHIH
jgi:hypothetical protein